MTPRLLSALKLRETDINGALKRLGGDEELYLTLLKQFVDDPTITQLAKAIQNDEWNDAFTFAHALKGLAGNMGFVQLMHVSGQLVIMIRGGRTREARDFFKKVESSYADIADAVNNNLRETQEKHGDGLKKRILI